MNVPIEEDVMDPHLQLRIIGVAIVTTFNHRREPVRTTLSHGRTQAITLLEGFSRRVDPHALIAMAEEVKSSKRLPLHTSEADYALPSSLVDRFTTLITLGMRTCAEKRQHPIEFLNQHEKYDTRLLYYVVGHQHAKRSTGSALVLFADKEDQPAAQIICSNQQTTNVMRELAQLLQANDRERLIHDLKRLPHQSSRNAYRFDTETAKILHVGYVAEQLRARRLPDPVRH